MSRRTFLATLAFLAFISLGLPDGLLGVSWPSIRAEFGVPVEALGLVVAITTAGYLTSSFLCGWLMRIMPLGVLLAISTAAASLALLGFAASPSFPVIVLLGFLAGLGGGAIDAGLNAYGAAQFSARTLNWLHAFFGVGSTAGPLIVTTVLGSGQAWQLSYVIVGVAQAALAVTFWLTRHRWRDPEVDAPGAEAPVAPARSRDTLRRPSVWLGMGIFFFYAGLEIGTAQWSYSILTLGRGMEPVAAGFTVTLYWGSLMVGRVLFGFIADRVPLVAALRTCILFSILGAALFALDSTPGLSRAGLMMMGFFFAPIFASLISLTPARVGRDHADSAIGFQIAAAGIGGAVITGTLGLVGRAFGLESIGVALVIATILLLGSYEAFMRRTARSRARAS